MKEINLKDRIGLDRSATLQEFVESCSKGDEYGKEMAEARNFIVLTKANNSGNDMVSAGICVHCDSETFANLTVESIVQSYNSLTKRCGTEVGIAHFMALVDMLTNRFMDVLPEEHPVKGTLFAHVNSNLDEEVLMTDKFAILTDNGMSLMNASGAELMGMFFAALETLAKQDGYSKEMRTDVAEIIKGCCDEFAKGKSEE